MKKLSIGFSKSKKNFPICSWLIRFYQGTEYSHIYLRLHTGPTGTGWYDYDQILHASEGLVQAMSEKHFDKRHIIVREFKFEIDDDLWNDIKRDAHNEAGASYGTMQNLGVAWVDFMRWAFDKRVSNPFQSGWNCSEYLFTKAVHRMYPKLFPEIDPNSITPKDIFQKLEIIEGIE